MATTNQLKKRYDILIGEELKRARKDKKMSQKQVADLCEISRVSVSYYEDGKRSLNLNDLIYMCQKCGFDYKRIIENVMDQI